MSTCQKTVFAMFAILIAAVAARAENAAPEGKWIQLFNGKKLAD